MTGLLEREDDLTAIAGVLAQTRGGSGRTLLLEGPPGVGKTALLGELTRQAANDGYQVLRARGSEMERDFGFGLVRQLFGPLLRALTRARRATLFSGPAALAAAVFGLADEGLETGAESSLYGLFWVVATLAEARPLALVVDDAHWGDAASLRFFHYLGRRLDGLPVVTALAARPDEPGVQGEALRALAADLDLATVHPAPLSAAGTATIVRDRLGAAPPEVERACHEATGGNPFLVGELLTELEASEGPVAAITPERIGTVGPERIASEAIARARRLDPRGPSLLAAVAVLGDGADLRVVAALAGVEPGAAETIVDGLAAAEILAGRTAHGFVHPLLRGAVYRDLPPARRAAMHARAAKLLAAQRAEPDAIAAHLMRCEPGAVPGAAEALEAAAGRAADRGAPDSAATYLR
ncbi:MAG TPA: AAA family ATPase, partial [Solirubrobacterales bacterium]|nr:AAA family ATPase [Solirubrobacterales bacterium]